MLSYVCNWEKELVFVCKDQVRVIPVIGKDFMRVEDSWYKKGEEYWNEGIAR